MMCKPINVEKELKFQKQTSKQVVEFIKELIEDYKESKYAGNINISDHDNFMTIWDAEMEAIYEIKVYPIREMTSEEIAEVNGEDEMTYTEYEAIHGSLKNCERNPNLCRGY